MLKMKHRSDNKNRFEKDYQKYDEITESQPGGLRLSLRDI
jgi:hypothetical protein